MEEKGQYTSKVFIGYSSDDNIRYTATSGGVGSSILKYLFNSGKINSAISFTFDSSLLQYIPSIIYKYDDYKITGSIYHEIDLYKFLSDNIDIIRSPFCCFALPCQVKPIKYLLSKNRIENIIIGLTCSSQQSIEATFLLLKLKKIKKENVEYIQYRNNGWPSGLTIILKNGQQKFVSNNNSIWTKIFHSRLFIQKKCFKCNNTLNQFADISLADPWLKNYLAEEKIGQTLFSTNNLKSEDICQSAKTNKYIFYLELTDDELNISQRGTIARKLSYKKNRKIVKHLQKLFHSNIYKKIVTLNTLLFDCHCKIKNIIERILLKL